MPHSTLPERKEKHEALRKIATNETIHNVMIADLDRRQTKDKPDLERMERLLEATARQLLLRKKRPVKNEAHSLYSKIWRIVDGAVKDALHNHPDYLTLKGRISARESINKRAVGAVHAFIRKGGEANRGLSPASCDSDTGKNNPRSSPPAQAE